jgi:hypothetical protein
MYNITTTNGGKMETQQKTTVSIALILDLLAITLITLRLIGVIQIDWVWVLSPWWIPLTLAAGITIASIADEWIK